MAKFKPLEFSAEYVGKRIKGTKKKITWKIELKGKEHLIEMYISKLSHKIRIFLDGDRQVETKNSYDCGASYTIRTQSSSMYVFQIAEHDYDLKIGKVTFQDALKHRYVDKKPKRRPKEKTGEQSKPKSPKSPKEPKEPKEPKWKKVESKSKVQAKENSHKNTINLLDLDNEPERPKDLKTEISKPNLDDIFNHLSISSSISSYPVNPTSSEVSQSQLSTDIHQGCNPDLNPQESYSQASYGNQQNIQAIQAISQGIPQGTPHEMHNFMINMQCLPQYMPTHRENIRQNIDDLQIAFQNMMMQGMPSNMPQAIPQAMHSMPHNFNQGISFATQNDSQNIPQNIPQPFQNMNAIMTPETMYSGLPQGTFEVPRHYQSFAPNSFPQTVENKPRMPLEAVPETNQMDFVSKSFHVMGPSVFNQENRGGEMNMPSLVKQRSNNPFDDLI